MNERTGPATTLRTARLALRAPDAGDADALAAYHRRNAERFAPWEPPQSFDPADHRAAIAEQRAREGPDRPTTFLAFAPGGGEVVGVVGLSGFTERPATAMVHYSVDGGYEGRGYAAEALAAVLDHAFDVLALEEISAYYHPGNARSGRLLQRLGFRVVAVTPVPAGFERVMQPQAWAALARANRPPAA